jgi:hypothetical protein
MSNLKLSDVSLSFSNNLHNLNEAREIFEGECEALNKSIMNLVSSLREIRNRDESRFITKIFYWNEVHDNYSTKKNGPWTNFVQRAAIPVCIKSPKYKNFDNNVAHLIFDISFDFDLRRFMFKVKFENGYKKNDQLDEKLFELALTKPFFKNPKHFKTSTAVIGCWEMDEDFSKMLNEIVMSSMDLVQEMIQSVYTENLYPELTPPQDQVVEEKVDDVA